MKFIFKIFKDSVSAPGETHCVSIKEANQSEMCREIIAVCCENYNKFINIMLTKRIPFDVEVCATDSK
jgi:hypothetical protein